MHRRYRPGRWLFVPFLLGVPVPAVSGQSVARVRSEENLRKDPNGEVLARLVPGSSFDVVGRRDRWLQIDLEGWIWERSLQKSADGSFDLVVSEPQGENLRQNPSGTIVARLARGMFLDEVDRRPGWIRVRRRAWVWSASVTETSSPGAAEGSAPAAAPRAAAPVAGGITAAGERGAAILVAPDGDTLARTIPRAEMAVVARQGNWARVRLEGWTWLPVTDSTPAGADAAPPTALTPAELTAEPLRYRGRLVAWELQFISLERAEKVRTDFYEGEPFLLTRFGGPEGPFVYVSVPPDRVREVGGLVPLERLSITGRVRTGASTLTGTPIVDLLTLERATGR